MEAREFKRFCKKIANDLANCLRYGEFVDAYVILVDKIYKNQNIFEEVTKDIRNDVILKEELARAFTSCIYTKEAKQVVNRLRKGNETVLDLKDYLEKELEEYIQKDVYQITRVSKRRLQTMLQHLEKSYNSTLPITEMQKAIAPNITWQDGLDMINNNIQYTRMRAQNAQRIALGMSEIDIQKFQDLQENEFLNEYRKFHNEDSEIANRIQIVYANPRKIELYIPKKEKFFDRLVSLNRLKMIPIYILDKMGILDIIRQRKMERDIERKNYIPSEYKKLQPVVKSEIIKKKDKAKGTTVQIAEDQNEVLYYHKKETVHQLADRIERIDTEQKKKVDTTKTFE